MIHDAINETLDVLGVEPVVNWMITVVNPATGETMQIEPGDPMPEGFVFAEATCG